MKKISHSKYKNTGIIFEILVRHLTSEAISSNNTESINLIKKYFTKTELAKENKLYQTLIQSQNLTERKAGIVLNTILELSKKLDRKSISKQKYNLIKEIKEKYNIDDFFKTSIPNYKTLASIYTILESTQLENPNINALVNSRETLVEHLTNIESNDEDVIFEEMSKMERGERHLVYSIMVEKFNKNFENLTADQKEILKEYVNSISSNSDNLKLLVHSKLKTVKESIIKKLSKVEDQVTKIKMNEIISFIDPILESKTITDDNVISLFQFQELENELTNI